MPTSRPVGLSWPSARFRPNENKTSVIDRPHRLGELLCADISAQFAPQLPSVSAARAFVADQLDGWELDDTDGSIVLLVSELVTNAMRHTGTAVELTIAVAEGIVAD